MSLRERVTDALSGDAEQTEHPTLDECGGCLEAWPCWQHRHELRDGTLVCDRCGRVLREP
jgi:hypothetical protein